MCKQGGDSLNLNSHNLKNKMSKILTARANDNMNGICKGASKNGGCVIQTVSIYYNLLFGAKSSL